MKKIFSFTLVLALVAAVSFSQEQDKKTDTGVSAWLKTLQSKISRIMPKKTVPMTTGVAGVRGAKEDAAVKLYWKGKKGEEAVTEEEMAKFKECVDLAEKGNRDESIKQLEEFMKVYPDSALIPDAQKTLDLVKAEPKQETKPKAEPVAATGPKPDEQVDKKPEQKPETPAAAAAEKKDGKQDEKK